MLFQGEEWGASTPFQYFTDHQEPDLAHAVSEGRKREFAAFGWDPGEIPDPQDPATFERSKLDWSEPSREPHKSILQWHRELIRLRASTAELRDGKLAHVEVSYDEEQRWIAINRGAISVAVNLGEQTRILPIRTGGSYKLLMASDERIKLDTGGIELPADSVAIMGLEK